MRIAITLIRRNVKLFFKDKGMFFTSLITPMILLVLYATFLGNVYRDSFVANLPEGFTVEEKIIDGLVAGQLVSSLLAVSCVTVAFCSNFLMVQDKANGTIRDFTVSPVHPSLLSFCYYIATLISTLLICVGAAAVCLGYLAAVGWYLSVTDVLCIFADVILLVFFGTALSSVINHFLHSQGQISAVGTVISSCYGFICGAYMPISSFNVVLRRVISFLPGTYGTSLIRNHCMGGALEALTGQGVPDEVLHSMQDALDCNLYFFEHGVSIPAMYAILGGSIALLVAGYVLLEATRKKAK